MAWRYECYDCNWQSTWSDKYDAEKAQHQHWKTDHNGKAAAREGFARNNAHRAITSPKQLLIYATLFVLIFLYWTWEKIVT